MLIDRFSGTDQDFELFFPGGDLIETGRAQNQTVDIRRINRDGSLMLPDYLQFKEIGSGHPGFGGGG